MKASTGFRLFLQLALLAVSSVAVFGSLDAESSSRDADIVRVLQRLQDRRVYQLPGRPCWRHSFTGRTTLWLNACAVRFLRHANRVQGYSQARADLEDFQMSVNITEAREPMTDRADDQNDRENIEITPSALKFKGRALRLSRKQARMLRKLQWSLVFRRKRDHVRVNRIQSLLVKQYNLAAGCYAPRKCLPSGEDNVKNFFRAHTDFDQLRYLWKSWRDATGRRMRSLYLEKSRLQNAAARDGGFKNYGYYEYYGNYQDANFPATMVSLYHQLKPLYEQLHAYVRHRLHLKYPGRFAANGLLPCHLGTDPWGLFFGKWSREFAPHPGAKSIDFDAILRDRERRGLLNLTDLPHLADHFYQSLGLPKMTPIFWRKSMFVKPRDRKVDCHGTAFDMNNLRKGDFRIKICSRMDMFSFSNIHHEMGHVIYSMLYARQPPLFQDSANPGFHEAVGDTITLSVSTAKHFEAIGFAQNVSESKESLLNTQLAVALDNLMLLPYTLAFEQWKWHLFSGRMPAARVNEGWWKLRGIYQGVGPPVNRSERDADILSKFHAVDGTPMIRYFVSYLLKFQFYKAMCKEAGHTGLLATCDFYRSLAAGEKLRRMLELGSSKPWPEALQQLTGRRDISADALLEYFQPLLTWLRDYNAKNSVPVGWTVPKDPMRAVSN